MKKFRENPAESYLLKSNQIKSIRNYWFFPALSLLSVYAVFFYRNFPSALFVLFVCVRLICTKQRVIIGYSFFVVLLGASFFIWQGKHLLFSMAQTDVSYRQRVEVSPNHCQINGQFLRFTGMEQQSSQLKLYDYILESQEEKEWWQNQSKNVVVTITGRERLPDTSRNLNGFNQRKYLAGKNIYRIVKVESMEVLETVVPKHPVKMIEFLRRQFSLYVAQVFPKLTSSYIKSLFLGIKDTGFQQEKDVFEELGILYFFSISGMHIFSFVAIFRYLFRRLDFTLETIFWLELFFLFIIYILAGRSVSVLRAVLVIAIQRSNQRFKWHLSALDFWSLALLVSLFFYPFAVLSVGGQLSFGLSLCILYIQPYLEQFPVLWQRKLIFSLLLTICSLPLTSFHFYEWNLLSLALSFVLLPFFQWVLLPALLLSVFLSFLFPNIFFIHWLEELLKLFHQVLQCLGEWDFTQMTTGTYSWILYCFLLFLLGAALHHLSENSKKSSWFLLLALLILGGQKFLKLDGIIAFVDVGQGDSVVVQEPFHGKVVVIDTGGRLNFSVEKWQEKEINRAGADYTLIPFLKSRGITRIDVLFASHGDEDHIGDLAELAEGIPIHHIVFGRGLEKNNSFLMEVKKLKEMTRLTSALGPRQLNVGNLSFDLLYPQTSGDGSNNHSLVLRTTVQDTRFLFTGDLEAEGERELMQAFPNLRADVLKVGHHGSRTSSTSEFINTLNPKTAIISCGRDNRFGHPHGEVVKILQENKIEILRTDDSGMVYYQWYPWEQSLTKIKTVNSKIGW